MKPRGKHPTNKLNAKTVNTAPAGRHGDGGGLYLEVDQSGARRWVLRVVVQGRRRDMGLGSASLIPLKDAREAARKWRRMAREGGDPVEAQRRERAGSITFAEAARRVHAESIVKRMRNTKAAAQWLATLEAHAFPRIGSRPVGLIVQSEVLEVLQPIWLRVPETARRVRQRMSVVFDWARVAGHRETANPCGGIAAGLGKQPERAGHHAALPWAEMPACMKRIEGVDGMGALALRFTILAAARSGEVRGATWSEMDLDGRVWTVPANRMKAGKEHRVPLSEDAVALLKSMPMGDGLVFPSARAGRPLSDMTLSAVLRRLDVPATVHGFRSTFRDWAAEATDHPREVAEAALAHTVGDAVERAYRRTDFFDRRRVLMEDWATFVRTSAPTPHL